MRKLAEQSEHALRGDEVVTDAREGLGELQALRLLVSNSTDMLSRHATDGTYLYASPSCRELVGYETDELVGRSAYELFHPADLAVITASHDEVLETPDLTTIEYRIRHKAGHWVWFETTSRTVRDPDTREVLEIHTSSRDVSARKDAEGRLQESEERFRLAMANAPIGMALVDLDGSWLSVNERLCGVVGRSEAELRALTFQDITHPDDLEVDLEYVQRLLAGDIDRYTMEKRYLHADGHVVWVLLSGSLVRDDVGQPLYFIAQVQDITDRKRHDLEVSRANDQLVASNVELERFASVASHDLRSPLASAVGLLDLVLTHRRDQLPDDVLDWLERTHRTVAGTLDTVEALLELARAGGRPLSTELVNVSDVVGDVLNLLGGQFETADAECQVERLPTVEADPALLRLVFQNLIANALKFRHPERRLVISIDASERASVWEFHVSDNGRGFCSEDVDVMFEPFGRTDTGEKIEGAGIGLATCRRIIERHGGDIDATPLAQGGRFAFSLPKPNRGLMGPSGTRLEHDAKARPSSMNGRHAERTTVLPRIHSGSTAVGVASLAETGIVRFRRSEGASERTRSSPGCEPR